VAVVQDYDTIQTSVLKSDGTTSVEFTLEVDDWDYVALIYAHNSGSALDITWPTGLGSQETLFSVTSGNGYLLVGKGFPWRNGYGKSLTAAIPVLGDIACVACLQIYHSSAFDQSTTFTDVWQSNPVSTSSGIDPTTAYSHIVVAAAYYGDTVASFSSHATATQPGALTERCDINGLKTGTPNKAVSLSVASAQSSSSGITGAYSCSLSGANYVEGEEEYDYSLALFNITSIANSNVNKMIAIHGG